MTGYRTVSCPILVQRQDVVERLGDQSVTAMNQQVTTLIAGEPGVGKTRVLNEAGRLAADRSFLVLKGQSFSESADRYDPVAGALRRYCRGLVPEEIDQLFAGSAAAARLVLPELLFEEFDVSSWGSEHVRASLSEVLTRIARDRPLMLALEDLHWAGVDGLELLKGALDLDAPIWLVATYRTAELEGHDQLRRLITRARKTDSTSFIELAGLDVDGTEKMVRAMLPEVSMTASFIEGLQARCDGNPFFIEEICRLLVQTGRTELFNLDDLGPTAIPLPASVGDALLSRFNSLSIATRTFVEPAAVAGDTVDLRLIAGLSAVSEEELETAVRDALDHQLIEERFDGPVPYLAFKHSLTREAIASNIDPLRRRLLHRRLAECIASSAQGERDEVAGAVADHLAAGGLREEAQRHALTAARVARTRAAYAEAASRFRQARLLASDDAARLPILLDEAETAFRIDVSESRSLAAMARALAIRLNDVPALARALLLLARTTWLSARSEARNHLDEGLSLCSGRQDRWELALLVESAYFRARSGWLDDARSSAELIQRALPLAEQLDDQRALGRLEMARGETAKNHADCQRSCRNAEQHLRALGDPFEAAMPLSVEALDALLQEGLMEEAHNKLVRMQEIFDALTPVRPSYPFAGPALAALWRGDVDAAQELLAAGSWAEPVSESTHLVARAEFELLQGGALEARRLGQRGWDLVASLDEVKWVVPAVAVVARAVSRLEGLRRARSLFEEALNLAGGSHLALHWRFSPDYAIALARNRLPDELDHLVARVEDATRAAGDRGLDGSALGFCRGVAAWAAGDLATAINHLEQALTAYREMAFAPRACETLALLAEIQIDAGEREAAAANVAAALGMAEGIRATPLAGELRSLSARLGRRGRAAIDHAAGQDALTKREREVVRLASEGLTAKDIADRLFLSKRTVEGHLDRAKAKLGVSSKAELIKRVVAEQI